jgi:hypothetical protein
MYCGVLQTVDIGSAYTDLRRAQAVNNVHAPSLHLDLTGRHRRNGALASCRPPQHRSGHSDEALATPGLCRFALIAYICCVTTSSVSPTATKKLLKIYPYLAQYAANKTEQSTGHSVSHDCAV